MTNHYVLTFNGKYDTLIKQPTKEYELIDHIAICDRVRCPTAVPKDNAPAIIPSIYNAFDGRSHIVQRCKGSFPYLCVDIDSGSHSLEKITTALVSIIGKANCVIYSTSSASQEHTKWRIIISLKSPIAGDAYRASSEALFSLLEEHGIKCDPALAREAQPVYLPNIPANRREGEIPDGSPLFYQFEIINGDHLDFGLTPIPTRIQEHADALASELRDRLIGQAGNKARNKKTKHSQNENLIGRFNEENPLEEMFEKYGYKYGGRGNWQSPNQNSGSYATKAYDDGSWSSLSTSDTSIGHPAKSGGVFGDAFDLYVFYECAGDFKVANRDLARRYGLPPEK